MSNDFFQQVEKPDIIYQMKEKKKEKNVYDDLVFIRGELSKILVNFKTSFTNDFILRNRLIYLISPVFQNFYFYNNFFLIFIQDKNSGHRLIL